MAMSAQLPEDPVAVWAAMQAVLLEKQVPLDKAMPEEQII
jgi:hypothetical protein